MNDVLGKCTIACLTLNINQLHRSLFMDHLTCTFLKHTCAPAGMNTGTSKASELEARLVSFAAEILSLSAKLPRTPKGDMSVTRFSNRALPLLQITVKHEERKAGPISFTSWALSSRN